MDSVMPIFRSIGRTACSLFMCFNVERDEPEEEVVVPQHPLRRQPAIRRKHRHNPNGRIVIIEENTEAEITKPRPRPPLIGKEAIEFYMEAVTGPKEGSSGTYWKENATYERVN